MTRLPSIVYSGGSPELETLFPTFLPEPEKLVYQHVYEATRTRIPFPEDPSYAVTLPATFSEPPALNFYPDGGTSWDVDEDDEAPVIPVLRGTSIPFPGKVPAIAVGLGNDSEDEATLGLAQFVGDRIAYGDDGVTFIGAASYYAQPLYASILVQLIHENRDERDRLHNELRRVLAPLTRKLPYFDPLIHRTKVSTEKQDTPMDEQPFVMYVSIATVEVWFEMLQAVDVVGPNQVIQSVPVTVTPDSTIPIPTEE